MEQTLYTRVLNGLKAIYAQRRSAWHGTPVSFEMKPDGIYGVITEQGGTEKNAEFSFRDSATGSWKAGGDSIKIFGQRYTLDGEKISR
jgi:hypothetical protein